MNNGFTKIPNDLLRNAMLTPTEKTVWGVIASVSNGYEPTIAAYCAMVRCHFNTWRAVIKRLQRFGMVTVEHSGNAVRYIAVTDPKKWSYPNNNCDPNKICEGNKNCEGKGNKNCEGDPNKICYPLKEHKKNNKKTTLVETRTRIREEVMTDAMVEMGCMSLGIDRGTYENLAYQVFTDWDFQDLPDSEWNKAHFLAVMRIKVNAKRNEQRTTNQQTGDTGDKLDRDAVKAMAALAESSRQPVEPTW